MRALYVATTLTMLRRFMPFILRPLAMACCTVCTLTAQTIIRTDFKGIALAYRLPEG